MGACIFCGQKAGLFRHEHKACRERHDNIETRIVAFFVEALNSSIQPSRFRELTENLARSAFIRDEEFRHLVLLGFAALIDHALANDLPTDAEESRVGALINVFGLKVSDLTVSDAGFRFAKASILRQLGEGKLPSSLPRIEGHNPINLENGEVIIWVFKNTEYFTPRTRTQYVGASQGVSVRVMKGVYYRVGSFKGRPVQTQYLSNEGTGDFVITNRNIYFLSPLKVIKLPARKIVAVEPHSDGLSISRDGVNSKPAIFTLDDPWFATNAITRINQLDRLNESPRAISHSAN